MKDWCHTNNILQAHSWRCQVVLVMFHALKTSSIMVPGHKVSQIWKLLYLCQYLSKKVNENPKISQLLMAIFLAHSTSSIISGKEKCRELIITAILKISKY